MHIYEGNRMYGVRFLDEETRRFKQPGVQWSATIATRWYVFSVGRCLRSFLNQTMVFALLLYVVLHTLTYTLSDSVFILSSMSDEE